MKLHCYLGWCLYDSTVALYLKYCRCDLKHQIINQSLYPMRFSILRLFGGYEALVAGKAKDAMVDMTGGVAEGIEIKDYKTEEEKKKLFKILRKSKEAMSLISTSIAVSMQVYQ